MGTYGELDGKLPPLCQETLDILLIYMKKFDVSKLPPATPVKEIKNVILTGVTGFVGRHFISLLLDRSDLSIEKVYCPVRADNDEQAMERIIKVMNDCNCWSESYRERICAFAGNLSDENFGASPELYESMTKSDCIYHFAASLNLGATFTDMREDNNMTMKPVIKACLTETRKHLFLGSTIGMFPQYFCLFANEMANKVVRRDTMPEIGVMKRLFPLSVAGYVWTKLINELLCFEMARVKSTPLAVFRMPNMYANSKSGMTTPNDPLVCMMQAVMQTRLCPGPEFHMVIEDSHVCNTMMLNISMNANRRNVIYHLSRHTHVMPTENSPLDMLGYKLKPVSYETFREVCIKMGEKSSLHGYWVLIDHFQTYWVRSKNKAQEHPIDTSTCE